jgi:GNAT superfamily N-acetyltransferase
VKVAVRRARPLEVMATAVVHVEADFETYRPIFGYRTVRRDFAASCARWSKALAAGDDLLVAEVDGRIVGMAHASGDWLSALYLRAAHRRRGLGRRLLAHLCRFARMRGVEMLRFQVVAENHAAIGFYEHLGGRAVGRRTQSEGDQAWEDLVFELPTAALAARRPASPVRPPGGGPRAGRNR